MHLKRIFVLLLLSSFSTVTLAKKFSSDDITGFWLSEKGTGVIEVYKQGDKYEGKLVWIKDIYEGKFDDKFDDKNPDEELRKRSLQDIKMLQGFSFNGVKWSGGEIYDPESGKTYSAYMKLQNENLLKLRGYIGVSFLGRTSEWTRQKSAVPDRYAEEK